MYFMCRFGTKLLRIRPKWYEMVQNRSKWSEMVSKWSKTIQNGPKSVKIAQNSAKSSQNALQKACRSDRGLPFANNHAPLTNSNSIEAGFAIVTLATLGFRRNLDPPPWGGGFSRVWPRVWFAGRRPAAFKLSGIFAGRRPAHSNYRGFCRPKAQGLARDWPKLDPPRGRGGGFQGLAQGHYCEA